MKRKGRLFLDVLFSFLTIGIVFPSSCAAEYAPDFSFFKPSKMWYTL
jgi:hypothetical protein